MSRKRAIDDEKLYQLDGMPISEGIAEVLQCSICFKIPTSKFVQCQYSHNVCESCVVGIFRASYQGGDGEVINCPTCRVEMPTPHVSATLPNKLLDMVTQRCIHCKKFVKMDDEEHGENCRLFLERKGSEAKLTTQDKRGHIFHFKGKQGKERLVKEEHPDGCTRHCKGKQGKERVIKEEFRECAFHFKGGRGEERLVKLENSARTEIVFYSGEKEEEEIIREERQNERRVFEKEKLSIIYFDDGRYTKGPFDDNGTNNHQWFYETYRNVDYYLPPWEERCSYAGD